MRKFRNNQTGEQHGVVDALVHHYLSHGWEEVHPDSLVNQSPAVDTRPLRLPVEPGVENDSVAPEWLRMVNDEEGVPEDKPKSKKGK